MLKYGVRSEDEEIVARDLVSADLRGVDTTAVDDGDEPLHRRVDPTVSPCLSP